MDALLFGKGLVLGVAIAAPLGPIGALCINRTLERGFWAGVAGGLGTALADGAYALMAAAGYAQYEVSAYARPGRQSAHNLNYWRFGDYLGIGAGAHGKLSFAHRVARPVRVREPRLYMERALAGDATASAAIKTQRTTSATFC